MHTLTNTYIHKHANIYTHTCPHTHANSCAHAYTQTDTHTHTYTHTHTHTHIHTHTHTHTHIHTHTLTWYSCVHSYGAQARTPLSPSLSLSLKHPRTLYLCLLSHSVSQSQSPSLSGFLKFSVSASVSPFLMNEWVHGMCTHTLIHLWTYICACTQTFLNDKNLSVCSNLCVVSCGVWLC